MALDRWTAAIVVLVVLAAGVIGVAAGAVLSSERGGTGTPGPVAVPDTVEEPVTPSRPATTVPAPSPAPGPTLPRVTVPVYVLGDTGSGPRLYREFREVGGSPGADRVRLAVAAMGAAPADRDYRSPWAGVPLAALTGAGTDATVTFGAAPTLRAGEAAMAVQQVVHTVTAADPELTRVRVVAPGLPASLTSAPRRRAPHLDVLAPVWLLAPADGARSGGRVVLTGTASVFEASVAIEVRRGARVAARTSATASAGAPERGEWTATVTLPPGDYTVAAYEVSARDGSRQFVDTKRVTVT